MHKNKQNAEESGVFRALISQDWNKKIQEALNLPRHC